MKKRIALSILIGAGLFYLSARGIALEQAWSALLRADAVYLLPAVFIQLALPVMRAFRLKMLFRSLHKIRFIDVFAINGVGYLFILLLPMRMGEFMILYLIRKTTALPLSSALAIIAVERITDLLVLLGILLVLMTQLLLPGWLTDSAIRMSGLVGVGLLVFVLVYLKSDAVFPIILKMTDFLPQQVHHRLERIFGEFNKGLRVIHNPWLLIKLIGFSVTIWTTSSLVIYCLFRMLHVELDVSHALVVMAINTFGVALPAGPGMMGNFRYSCTVALGLFGTDKALAFTFANVYYILAWGMTFLIGFLLLPSAKLSLRELRHDMGRLIRG